MPSNTWWPSHQRLNRLLTLSSFLLLIAASVATRLPAQSPTTRSGRPVDPAAVENLNRINDARVQRGLKPLAAPGYTYIPPEQRQPASADQRPAADPRPASAASAVPAVATVRELRWVDLVNRPEFWPAQCTLKQTMEFEGGASVRAGQKVKVDGLTAQEVELSTVDNKVQFAAASGQTDVLEVANREYAALSPEQRELSYSSLARRKALWPYRVKIQQTFDLGRGQRVQPGDEAILMKFERGKLTVLAEKTQTSYDVEPQATDLMAQARQHVVAGENAPSRVGTELEGKLVSSVTGQPTAIDPKSRPQYFVFYRGSSTCPITRQFTPSLIKYYNETKPQHPEFEIIYIMTESPKDTGVFARELGFSWPAVEYGTTGRMPVAGAPFGSLLPQLVVMDRGGNVLANGVQNTAVAALQKLDGLLNRRTATAGPPR